MHTPLRLAWPVPLKNALMKTLYLIKSILPFIFLPIAPGMLQIELARQGVLTGYWAFGIIAAQGIFTLGTIGWLGLMIARRERKAFLRMSCVSKKVFFQGRWMTVEQYLAEHHNVVVSHGMTPEETREWVADAEQYLREQIPHDLTETTPLPDIEARKHSRELQETAA